MEKTVSVFTVPEGNACQAPNTAPTNGTLEVVTMIVVSNNYCIIIIIIHDKAMRGKVAKIKSLLELLTKRTKF